MPTPRVLVPALAALPCAALLIGVAAAQQSLEARIAVPGLGQPVASGLYFFKLALVDAASNTLWSNDGSSVQGSEPHSFIELFVENGSLSLVLGEPPASRLPPVPPEALERNDVSLRTWVANAATPQFVRLPDQRLGGKGYAYAAELARNAELLQGKRAADFEASGSTTRHEAAYVHTPKGHVPGGRFHYGSVDLGGGRELRIHFDAPEDNARLTLSLHGSPAVGAPGLEQLRMETVRAQGPPVGGAVEILSLKGAGWLGGVHESYSFCNTCFRRRLPPETDVYLDGALLEAWRAARKQPPDGAQLGHVESFLPVGLLRFQRSLRVVSEHRGVDDPSGQTTVWYYTQDAPRRGAPGAIEVRLDGGDVTSALVGLPGASASTRSLAGRLVAARFDGNPQPGDALQPAAFLPLPAAATWLTDGPRATSKVSEGGSSLVALGEVELQAGERRLRLEGHAPAVLELRLGGTFQRVAFLAADGAAEASIAIPRDGDYQVRMFSSAPVGELSMTFSVDGQSPRVHSVPLLGGDGAEDWSARDLDFQAAGIPVSPGPHILTLRERSGRGGHLEYSLLVE